MVGTSFESCICDQQSILRFLLCKVLPNIMQYCWFTSRTDLKTLFTHHLKVLFFNFCFYDLVLQLRCSHFTLSNVSLLRAFSCTLIIYALLHREQIGLIWPRRLFLHPLCPESRMSWMSATFLMNLPGWYLLIHLPLCLRILTRYSR